MDERSTTPVQFLRDISARQACLRRLAQAHDRFAELEQILYAQGDVVDAEGAHRYAMWTLRAYRAEMDDREPPQWVGCVSCGWDGYLAPIRDACPKCHAENRG